MSNLTILIYSGDVASWVWPFWKEFWLKHWKSNGQVRVIFVSENKGMACEGVESYLTRLPGKGNWSNGLLKAIDECVDTKYVIFGHEDYFLVDDVYEEKLLYVSEIMERRKLMKVKLFRNLHTEDAIEANPADKDGLHYYDQTRPYLGSFQPGIWNVDFLKYSLKAGENSWQAEVQGGHRIEKNYSPLYVYKDDIFPYIETVRVGKKRPNTEQYFDGSLL